MVFSWLRRSSKKSMEEKSRKFRRQFEERKSEVLLEIRRSSDLITNYNERLEREKKNEEEKEERRSTSLVEQTEARKKRNFFF